MLASQVSTPLTIATKSPTARITATSLASLVATDRVRLAGRDVATTRTNAYPMRRNAVLVNLLWIFSNFVFYFYADRI